jgi:GT2 family glycosyltransferase
VIIPSRDNLNLLQPCVESLIETMAAPSATEIIIIDNGSTDKATLAWLNEQKDQGNIRVITSDTPFNWAGLNNHAAEHTDAEYLLFLNDDTKSVTQRWDERLRAQLERSDIGVVGARLFYEDGTLQHGGVVINSLTEVRPDAIVHEASGEAPDQGGYLNRSRLCHRVSAVTGAFLACKARDFKALEGFDAEHLGIAFNDIDFCLKIAASGKAVLYDPALTFFHYESKSRGYDSWSEEKQSRFITEQKAMMERWGDIVKSDPFYPEPFLRRGKAFQYIRNT